MAICTSTPLFCKAGFEGFPLADSTTNFSWYAINEAYAPLAQIYSGIVERCEVVSVDEPLWTQELRVDNSVTGTVESLVVTNAIGPVPYSNAYTNGLAYPVVSHAMLAELDDVIDALIPKFASTNTHLYPDSSGGTYTRPMLFSEIGVGLVYTNVATVGGSPVTNVVARWTRSPERRWSENLVEMHHAGTNGWQLIAAEPVEWWHAAAATAAVEPVSAITGAPLPFVAYGPTTTTWSVSLAGLDLYGSHRTETVTVGNECTVGWRSITGMPVVGGFDGSVTGAWFAVQYTNNTAVYGERPYRLYATDLDERAAVLSALVRTVTLVTYLTNGYYARYAGDDRERWGSVWGFPVPPVDEVWDDVKNNAVADWQDVTTPAVYIDGIPYGVTYGDLPENRLRRYWTDPPYLSYLDAEMEGSYFKPYLRGLSTNISKAAQYMVYIEDTAGVVFGGGFTEYTQFNDFGTGHTNGQWNIVGTGTVGFAANHDCPAWFPATPAPVPLPFSTTNPESNGIYRVQSSGRVPTYGCKALVEWDFQYK